MKAGILTIYYPANATEEAAVPVGSLVVRASEAEVKLKSASGIESVATSSTVSGAVATVAIKDWQASTAVSLNEMRRATVSAGTIELGDLIRSNSARTTGATFDATEAGNWTEFAPDIVTSVGGQTGAVMLKTVNGTSLLGAGDVALAADLPGGVAATALDDGLDAGTAVIDRATVSGQTVIRYATTGTSTFKVPAGVTEVEALVVAGGGGGGSGVGGDLRGGGGGAGGLISNAAFVVTPGASLAVTVGAGGAAAANGNDSVFATLTADGGGRGGSGAQTGFAGGSGGGGGAPSGGAASFTGGAGTVGEGNDGGTGGTDGTTYRNGGGGGGAGAVGGAGSANGVGGAGLASLITGASVTYAGGGGGGGPAAANGGAGGGGRGGAYSAGAATAGIANTGSGGGGGANTVAGASGGSGVVIIRFPTQTRSYQALTSYADNAAALAAGKLVGQFYKKTADGSVQQVTA